MQIENKLLRIPTGGRLTSWLLTRRGGVEFGATEDKSIQWHGGGFEPGTSGLQDQRPTTRPRPPPALVLLQSEWTPVSSITIINDLICYALSQRILIDDFYVFQ